MRQSNIVNLSMVGLLFLLGCSSGEKGKKQSNGVDSGPPPTQWVDDGDDVQDTKPWGQAGPGVGAPAPESYLGTNANYDPGCYRYFSAEGTGDGTTASAPAGNAIAAINAICASESERANAKGKRLCLRRGDEFYGTPDPMSHTLISLAWCDGVSIEDFGDQRLARPRILGSRRATGTWSRSSADGRIYQVDLTADLQPGYTWQSAGQSRTDEERVDQLFFDGKKMLLARYPNFGEGKTDPTFDPKREPTGDSMSYIEVNFPDRRAFRDPKLPTESVLQNPVDWTGAHLHYKHATWITDGTLVTGYDAANHELTTRTLVATAAETNKGYFVNNHIAALDQAGEWFYDSKSKTLYFWAPGDVDPNQHRIDISFARYNTPMDSWDSSVAERRGYNAFRFQYAKGVTLRNLEVRHFSGDGISVGGPGTVVTDCHFEGIGETGLGIGYNMEEAAGWGLGAAPSRIENTRIENAGCNGILMNMPDSVAANNTLVNIGSLEQYGPNGTGLDAKGCDITYHETGFGILMGGHPRQVAKNNFLERIGHNGVGFHGPDSVVDGNVIHLASVTKGDSGGVKCWAWDDALSPEVNFARPGVTGSVVQNNIVVETIGTAEGVNFPGVALGNGFFIDFGCQGTTFKNNVAARSTTQGMLFTIDRNQTVTGNTIFGNGMKGGAQLYMGDCRLPNCPNSVHDNVIVPTMALQQSFAIAKPADLTADRNAYLDFYALPTDAFSFNPDSSAVCSLITFTPTNGTCHTLTSFRTATGQDANGSEATAFWRDEYVSDYLSDDLLANPGFDEAASPWSGYLGTATWDESGPMGPSLRLERSGERGSLQATLAVTKNTTYEVRVRTQGASSAEPRLVLEVVPIDLGKLWEDIPIGLDTFRLSNTSLESSVIFRTLDKDTTGYFRLTSAASRFWVDDLHVRQVETYRVPRGVVLRPGDHIPKAARIVLFVNPSTEARTVPLYEDAMLDAKGSAVTGSFELGAFASRVLVAGAKLGLGKSQRDLGPVALGSSASQTPVLTNIGTRPLSITSAKIRESGSPFTVSSNCDGTTLEPGAVCALQLSFAPVDAGDATGTLVISTNDGQGSERTVTLTGRGE